MRKDSIFEDVIKMPWPVGVGLALIIFFCFHTYQLVAPQTQFSQAVFPVIRTVAYIFIALFLFAAFLSFLTQKIRSKRFRTTKSMSDIRSLSWRQFETYMAESFREQGYFVVETPEGPDNGVDLVLRKDGEKTYVQCKHWKTNNVGVQKVRELLGAMAAGGAHNGIFVTSGAYTQPAKAFARENGIKLVDGTRLGDMIGSPGPASTRVDQVATESPLCPECGADMVRRMARRGQNAGNEFWGCSKFPGCKYTRSLTG